MKFVLLSTALVAITWAIPHPVTLDEEWNEYKKSFGKFYTSEEEDVRRLNAYLATKGKVDEHNGKYERGETSYTMAMNKFADWFPEELSKMNGLKVDEDDLSKERTVFELPSGVEVPDQINWVKKGAVTSVKDQGYCGSCYAFSAVGALEGLMYVTNKTITDLSVQELVDCSRHYGNLGCNGGRMDFCFMYVGIKKGISTNESYSYEAKNGICRAKSGKFGATCTGYMTLIADEDNLKNAVGTIGPVSVSFKVSRSFMNYKSGIFDGGCSAFLNHGMVIVGYGKDRKTKKDYWLVKNSWGKAWGIKGYAKIVRNVGKCGIHLFPSYPIFHSE